MAFNLEKVLAYRATERWFRAEAAPAEGGDGIDRIYIDGVIGGGFFCTGTGAKDFREAAAALTAPTLEVHINSPGGSVDEGLAIYAYLADDPRKIVTVVDGMAASIASVIFMAGDERRIGEAATIMVHKPWTVAAGDDAELRAASIELGHAATRLAKIYQRRTGQTFTRVESLMAGADGFDGTIMGSETAIETGFADTVIPAKEAPIAAAAAWLGFFDAKTADAADPEKRRPCESEEPEDPEKKPEPEKDPAPQTIPAEPAPEPAREPATDPQPEPTPETAPAEPKEPEQPEEPVPPRRRDIESAAPAPRRREGASALRPEPTPSLESAPTSWVEARARYGYTEARKKFPALYEDFIAPYRKNHK